MRPLLLEMRAFGAYATEQKIDFTVLGDKKFFLITGPTGAGKTTILDAMTFALYGTSSGALRDGKSLRSDYASPETPTNVAFTFALGAKKYKVERMPEQVVEKKRGSGTHSVKASASLCEILDDGSVKVLAQRVEEVTKKITELLGFKAEQFTQIVLLPQGEFRKFLLAESQNRKTILETIFKTGFYSRLESVLVEQAKALEVAYDEDKKKQNLWLQQLDLAKPEDIEAKLLDLQKEHEALSAKVKSSEVVRTKAREALSAAEALANLFNEERSATQALQHLATQKDIYAQKEQALKLLEAAQILVEPYNAAKTAQKAVEEQKQTLNAAQEEAKLAAAKVTQATGALQGILQAFNVKVETPEVAEQELEKVLAALQEEAGKLVGVSTALKKLAAQLVDGKPCPVCGSTTHPRPADKVATEQETLQKEITAKKQQAASLRQVQQDLKKAQNSLLTAQKAVEVGKASLQKQEETFAKARETFKVAFTSSCFKDQAEFLTAANSIKEKATLQRSIQKYAEDLAAAKDRHSRAVAAIKDKQEPNLELARKTFTEQQNIYDDNFRAATVKNAELEQYTKGREELRALSASMAKVDEKYKVAAALAKIAKGDNADNISLSAFVLQAILDDVLVAANLRLHTMTQGRYQLRRSVVLLDGRKQSGLNIEVQDAFTGVPRPVKTLSGGEIFLASLALALGLTDVVQAYAGGLKLDTILVDEGFGSLDPDALDAAMEALLELQQSGRLVGIISHVTDLVDRIPERLEIIPSAKGSSAVWHV
jgi:exonuclease SbcC